MSLILNVLLSKTEDRGCGGKLQEAEYLGVPKGCAIYFTVDYEAQDQDIEAIKEYLHGVHTVLTGKYLVGIYGPYAVINAMKGVDYPPDRYFQTYAWSYGKVVANHIYQYSNDITVADVACDKDYVNDDAGLWGSNGLYQVDSNAKESEETMDHAVMYFTVNDFSISKIES